MVYREYAYYIMLEKKSRGYEVVYSIGGEGSVTAVIRLEGKRAGEIFRGVIEALAKYGAAVPSKLSDYEQVYGIREDLGPIVGAYLILVRRARNIEKWNMFFRELLDERYVGMAKVFSHFLELAIELSRSMPNKVHNARYTLLPSVIDALSAALKQFVNKMTKVYRG